jgi:hypothetical protein
VKLPDLPFGLGSALTSAALIVFLAWFGKKLADEIAKNTAQGFWKYVTQRDRSFPRRHELQAYRENVAVTYNAHALGFLQDSPVTISDVYVPLQYEEGGRRLDVYESIRSQPRTVILGAAGAGKSMLLKNSMVKWSAHPNDYERIPVFVELSRANADDNQSLFDLISATFRRNGVRKPEKFLFGALAGGFVSVFLDGLDEVVTSRREVMADRIERFAEDYPKCQLIVTCREAVYDNDLRSVFRHEIRISGFDDAAIYRFLRLWLSRDREQQDLRYEVEQLVAALRASPALLRLARSPLLITMIATLYDADPGIGPTLSNSRAEFYELAVSHLLRRDRDLGRHGAIATYKAGHKFMVLRAAALVAQGTMVPGSDRRTISEQALIGLIASILSEFNLSAEHAPKLLEEVVARSGLLIRVDEGNLLYEFPHLTLQEYLAAMELADDPDKLFDLYLSNPVRWRETLKLWCGGANRDCTRIVEKTFSHNAQSRTLALECIAEARRIDDGVAQKILEFFEGRLGRLENRQHLILSALGAVAADSGPRGQQLMARLQSAAFSQDANVSNDAVYALAATRLRSAIETVSEVAQWSNFARTALISMGDQAVPVLERRAEGGMVGAVDDLQAIGTPSAAVALSKLIWREDLVAIRAAWRLAALVNNVDVEEELKHIDLQDVLIKGARFGWIWEPFAAHEQDPLREVMGRAAYLIESCGPAELPDATSGIDPRIALPLAVRGIARSDNSNGSSSYSFMSSALEKRILRTAMRLLSDDDPESASRPETYSHELHRTTMRLRARNDAGESLRIIANKNPAEALLLSHEILLSRDVPIIYRSFAGELPTSVRIEISALLLDSRLHDVGEADWRRVREPVREPKVLRRLAWIIPIATAVTLASIGLALSVVNLLNANIGVWRVVSIFTVLLTLSAVTGVSLSLSDSGSRIHRWMVASLKRSDPEDLVGPIGLVLGLTAMTLGIGTTIFFATLKLGFVGVAAPLGTIALTSTVLLVLLERRNRILRNPFRTLLMLDERVAVVRATVIAPKQRVSPEDGSVVQLASPGEDPLES